MTFNDFQLHEDILKAIDELGFEQCTDVQSRTLSESLSGRDVAVQSQTGTGKTAAFLITIFHLLLSDERFSGKRALIVAPTRELAVQIEKDAKDIGKHLPYRTVTIYGGVGYKGQESRLREGVDIIIATPGRLLDLEQSKTLRFDDIAMLVIDEADRLFDMGFYPDVRKIFRKMPKSGPRLTMLFSATLSTRVRNLAWEYMNAPAEIEVETEHVTVDLVDQLIHHVSKEEKMRALLGVLQREQPQNALVFTNTKHACEKIAKRLELNGYTASYIMGDIPQKKRLAIIERIKSGELPVLVATDVAARGLHIEGLDMVVNYDIPEDSESYVHRIGRTGRAGKRGRAVTLACEQYVFSLPAIEEFIEMKIPVEHLGDEDYPEDKSEGVRIPRDSDRTGSGSRKGGSGGRDSRGGGSRGGEGARKGSRRGGSTQRRESPQKVGSGGGSGARGSGSDARGSSSRARGGSGGARDSSGSESAAKSNRAGGVSRSEKGSGNRAAAHANASGPKPSGPDASRSNDGPAKAKDKKASSAESGTGDRRNRKRSNSAPSKHASVDDRLAYYQEKYGEDFAVAGSAAGGAHSGPGSSKQKQKGLWRRLKRAFGAAGGSEGSS